MSKYRSHEAAIKARVTLDAVKGSAWFRNWPLNMACIRR